MDFKPWISRRGMAAMPPLQPPIGLDILRLSSYCLSTLILGIHLALYSISFRCQCSVAFLFCAFRWASLATLAACSWRFIILSYISLYNNISNRCSQQLVFARSYIKNEKLGIASAALGYPPSEGPIMVIITYHCPETTAVPGNCLQCANVSFQTQTNNRTFKSK